jgi:hypothetical protein
MKKDWSLRAHKTVLLYNSLHESLQEFYFGHPFLEKKIDWFLGYLSNFFQLLDLYVPICDWKTVRLALQSPVENAEYPESYQKTELQFQYVDHYTLIYIHSHKFRIGVTYTILIRAPWNLLT